MIRYRYITLVLVILSTVVKAQNIEFIENKGQWDSHVKFKSEVPGGSFFIRNGGFTVLQQNEEDLKQVKEYIHGQGNDQNKRSSPLVLRSHAYAVDFAGSSKDFELIPDKPLEYYNNYFIGNDPSKWASNCKIYQGVTAKNIYPNVDVRFYTDKGNMKYDIIVKPGADVSKIVLRYSGADDLEVRDKQLVIKTSVGDVKESDPYTYQYENNQRKQISAKYVLIGKEIRFDVKNYNRNEVLIIDPTLIFSSFSGSAGDNYGFTATYGPDGSFYGGGINLKTGYPVTPGAFQSVWGGGAGSIIATDISISKLSSNGTSRIYATYLGGSGNEQPHSLVVDGAGNLIVAGRTNSSDFPVKGTGQIGPGGGYDIIVTKFNAAGSDLIGSIKIGGKSDDGVNIAVESFNSLQQNYGDNGRSEVILDGSGNIYVASCSRSTDFPTTPGAFQPNPGGGDQDAVVLKFNASVSLLFASYLGGDANDAAYVLSLAPNGDIYVGGGTESAKFPGTSAGVIHSTNQGGIDGFVSVISNNGIAIIRSTYVGTPGTDQVYGVQFDKYGFPYICGQTKGNWPIINAAYSVAGAPQFIAKLQPDLSAFIYSTRFGRPAGVPNISITAFLVDNCENVYVSGWGGVIDGHFESSLTSGMPVTSDALQSTTDGSDFYFFVLKKNATAQLFGSFWGQNGGLADHVDGGTSRFDKQGVIYQAICANCFGKAVYLTTPGASGPINGTTLPNGTVTGCNLAMLKISFDFAGVDAGLQSMINGVRRDTAGCAPLTVDFIDTVANAVKYYWYFGDGSSPNPAITTVPNISHTYNLPGLYQVMLIAEDSTTCNIRDTAYLHIKAGNLPAILDFNPVKLSPCDSLKYRFDNLSTTSPLRPFTNTSFTWDFGDNSPTITAGLAAVFHSYTSPGTYTVKLTIVDTAYCNAPDTLKKTIRIAPLVVAQFETPPTGCAPYTAQFTNTSIAGQSFIWDFGDNTTSTATDPVHTYTTPGPYTITLIANDPSTCNLADTTTTTINVFPIPVSNFTFSPDPPVENTPTSFNNLASPDAVKFKWLFGDGDSLQTNSRSPVKHQYNATGTYNACLIAINSAGCADTLCQDVRAVVFALVDVPNAFTPQRGDVNSVVYARGFGITKIRFIIWNRWGQKVFETSDKNIGWDGKYKGVIQPMDVYVYTLDVEFFDGTKAIKKGDISLIR
ncbi:MAG TPA: PKD domain-containing protein [Chitinophagaceae bacterium]|nr:PKD domain-containing protein [Chitinophagaceae bacterium]